MLHTTHPHEKVSPQCSKCHGLPHSTEHFPGDTAGVTVYLPLDIIPDGGDALGHLFPNPLTPTLSWLRYFPHNQKQEYNAINKKIIVNVIM